MFKPLLDPRRRPLQQLLPLTVPPHHNVHRQTVAQLPRHAKTPLLPQLPQQMPLQSRDAPMMLLARRGLHRIFPHPLQPHVLDRPRDRPTPAKPLHTQHMTLVHTQTLGNHTKILHRQTSHQGFLLADIQQHEPHRIHHKGQARSRVRSIHLLSTGRIQPQIQGLKALDDALDWTTSTSWLSLARATLEKSCLPRQRRRNSCMPSRF